MKPYLFPQVLVGCGIMLGAIATLSQPSYAQDKFFCGLSNGAPATIVRTSRGNIPLIRWTGTSFPPPWTPQERCEKISTRFQRFLDNGTLNYIKGGWFNRQPVLCVAKSKGGPCLSEGLLVTLKPGSDPNITLQRLLDRRAWAASKPLNLSGGSADEELISEVDGEIFFNLKSFLNEDEGSTSPNDELPQGPVWEW